MGTQALLAILLYPRLAEQRLRSKCASGFGLTFSRSRTSSPPRGYASSCSLRSTSLFAVDSP